MTPHPSSETTEKINRSIMESHVASSSSVSLSLRILSALLYAFSSFFITAVNKIVLTTYKFPSFQVLGIGQMLATISVLFIAKKLHIVSFPDFSRDLPKRIFPLPLFFLGNLVFGLGGTQSLSLPMFSALRRFSILFTMLAQSYILGVTVSVYEQIAVYGMVFGACVAASNDLAFDAIGYTYLLVNNVFTACNNVYVKKKIEAKDLGKNGVMFYNSIFMVWPAVLFAWEMGDIEKAIAYPHWLDIGFLTQFLLSCLMGFILTLSIFLCTAYNGPLTTTVVGCLKNIFITYLGMFIGGDYVFSVPNFIGLNLSITASLFYTYVAFKDKSPSPSPDSIPVKSSESSDINNISVLPRKLSEVDETQQKDGQKLI